MQGGRTESLHNLFPGWTEDDMHNHGGGGLPNPRPNLPPTDKNKEMLLRELSIWNEQLL